MRLRIASFNLENLDDRPGLEPSLDERLTVLRPQLRRCDADVLCLQEVHGQETGQGGRDLLALDRLLEGTAYAGFERATTTSRNRHGPEPRVADVHNLVLLSRFPIRRSVEIRHDIVPPIAWPSVVQPGAVATASFERPALACELTLPDGRALHVLDLHLRAPLAAFVPGQKLGAFAWRNVSGWAEGYLLAAVKRAAQALEVRLHLERLLDAEPEALIAVVGDLNAEDHETPMRLLLAETADTGNGKLAARSLVALERGLAPEQRYSAVHHGRRVMLDHILVSRALLGHFRRLEVHAETLDDELAPGDRVEGATESYHAPIVAELEL